MTKTQEQIRDEFEAWVQNVTYNKSSYGGCLIISKDDDGNYTHPDWLATQFEAWQACQSLNNTALAEKDAEIVRLREAHKEAILGLREIAYVYGMRGAGKLAAIFISISTKILERTS